AAESHAPPKIISSRRRSIWISSFQTRPVQFGCLEEDNNFIAICFSPPQPRQHLEQRIILRKQCMGEAKAIEVTLHTRTHLNQLNVVSHELDAVIVAASVEEHLSRTRKMIDQIAAVLVG